jgi:hypothetical protein
MKKTELREGGMSFTLAIPGWLNTRDLNAELKDKSQTEARAT